MPVKPSDYKLKVALGLPFSGRYVPPEWAVALATIAWPMNCRYAFIPAKNLPREEARTEIVEQALKHRAQYVAMLDDDVQPPADFVQALVRELDSRPEFDIISAVVPSQNHEPMVFEQAEMGPFWRWKKGEVREIAQCATACVMIRTSVFQSLPKPWFRDLNTIEERIEAGTIKPGEADRGAMTDDIYFCYKAAAAGHRILMHGGVLPIHWDRKGNYAELLPDSYPFQSDTGTNGNNRVNVLRALEISGWMTHDELAWLATEASRATVKRIVEIGSWMGRSTRAFADNIQPGGVVYAVDTWNGSPEHRAAGMDKLPEDWVYDQFRANMKDRPNVVPLRKPSIEAVKDIVPIAGWNGDGLDLVFIDGDHSYESVKQDIASWRPFLRPGAVLCGHDYGHLEYTGVKQAVDELVPGAKLGAGSIWYDVMPG